MRALRWSLLAVAGVALAWFAEDLVALRHRFSPKRFGVVEAGEVYRSGQIAGHLIDGVLRDRRIGLVVDLTDDNPTDPQELADQQAEQAAIARLGVERRQHVLIADGTGDVVTYADAVRSVVEGVRTGRPVLVHCAAGTQCTGGVIALYRLLVQHQPADEVLREMQYYKYNYDMSPQLLDYLNDNLPALADELVRNGAIDQVPNPLPRLGDATHLARDHAPNSRITR
ncbi:MAG: tyrosine-protein phosphatase [Planctomycetaceae bacterium]